MQQFEYVVSGTAFFKLQYKESERPHNVEFFRDTIGSLNNTANHKVSLLYNAYTEKNFGEKFKDVRNHVHTIHADSGGLQMITLGRTITEELKEEVYSNQAEYSDIAMCFDVIPVMTIGSSGRLDLDNRRFDRSKLEECAKATGKNLKRQIEFFLEKKSSAKPMLIAQGNDYDSYMLWVDYIVKELPQEYVKHIGGIAMGAAALGKGTLEDIKRAFYFTQLPIDLESKHLHLLGVGSLYRMIPNLIFFQNGLYDGVNMSYDSTTHSSSAIWGRYCKGIDSINITRALCNNYNIILDDIKTNFPFYEYDVNTFHAALNMPTRGYEEKYGNIDPSLQTFLAWTASGIKNFIIAVDELSKDKEKLLGFVDKLDRNSFNALYSVKTTNDFEYWLKHVGRYVASEPVLEYTEQNTLEGLFT